MTSRKHLLSLVLMLSICLPAIAQASKPSITSATVNFTNNQVTIIGSNLDGSTPTVGLADVTSHNPLPFA
jgi:hypothetical protein